MSSEFWGLLLAPNKKYCSEADKPIRITTACFGDKVQKGSRSCVYLKTADKEFVFCVLKESINESQSLDVCLPADAEYSFRVSGPNEVHLTGHLIEEVEENDYSDELEYLTDEVDSDEFSDESDSMQYIEEAKIEELTESEEEVEKSSVEIKDMPQSVIKPSPNPKPIVKSNGTPAGSAKDDDSMAVVVAPSEDQSPANENRVSDASEEANDEAPEILKNQKKAPAKFGKHPNTQNINQKENQKRNGEETPVKNKKAKFGEKQKQQNQASTQQPTSQAPKALPKGLQVEDTSVGNGRQAKINDTLHVRYIGRFRNGKVFDKNVTGAPFTFRLGKGEVIKGWDAGLVGMKVGGERRLIVPPYLAYGNRGAPPDIPPKTWLNFEIKLLDIE